MGVGFQGLSSGVTDQKGWLGLWKQKPKAPNPDPHNFRIIRYIVHAPFIVAEVVYPDCDTFEGHKILLLETTREKFEAMKVLDPHFSVKSPLVARFAPNPVGWEMANRYARIYSVNT